MSQVTVTERGLDDDREIAMTIMNTFYPRGLSGDERWGECDPDAVEAFFAAEERRFYETPYIRCFKAMLNGKTVGCATWDVIHDPVQARKEAKPMTPLPEGASEHAHFFKRALDYQFSLWTIPRICELNHLAFTEPALTKGYETFESSWFCQRLSAKALARHFWPGASSNPTSWVFRQYSKPVKVCAREVACRLNLSFANPAGFPVYKSLGFKEYMDPLHEGPGLFVSELRLGAFHAATS